MEAANRHLVEGSGLYVVQGSYYCDKGKNVTSDQNVPSTTSRRDAVNTWTVLFGGGGRNGAPGYLATGAFQ